MPTQLFTRDHVSVALVAALGHLYVSKITFDSIPSEEPIAAVRTILRNGWKFIAVEDGSIRLIGVQMNWPSVSECRPRMTAAAIP
jgi:hypothetical protein